MQPLPSLLCFTTTANAEEKSCHIPKSEEKRSKMVQPCACLFSSKSEILICLGWQAEVFLEQ